MFIHQAVMEALTCGTTELTSQNLRIRMNKLARVMSDAKQTGYAEEFKVLVYLTLSNVTSYILYSLLLNGKTKVESICLFSVWSSSATVKAQEKNLSKR